MTNLLNSAGLAKPAANGHSLEELYASEQAILATDRIIPLFHLPVSYASMMNTKGWRVRPDGSLDLADAWLKRAP
jgi:MarR-like DNA-binding transcriptional regulator SgrR of sgrS sRNA